MKGTCTSQKDGFDLKKVIFFSVAVRQRGQGLKVIVYHLRSMPGVGEADSLFSREKGFLLIEKMWLQLD